VPIGCHGCTGDFSADAVSEEDEVAADGGFNEFFHPLGKEVQPCRQEMEPDPREWVP
jgi:hypothetical protein